MDAVGIEKILLGEKTFKYLALEHKDIGGANTATGTNSWKITHVPSGKNKRRPDSKGQLAQIMQVYKP